MRKRARLCAGTLSLLLHLLILFALFAPKLPRPIGMPPFPMTVALVEEPRLARVVAPPGKSQSSRGRSAPQRAFRPPRALQDADAAPLPASDNQTPEGATGLGEAQLAGAATAESNPAGGACDMVRSLEAALRKDPLVQAAVAPVQGAPGSAGRAITVWNGDWVASAGQEGKGLAAVREAIMWDVGFAPEACRKAPVRGLVLISLNDAPGSPRLILGSGEWRWSDLVTATRPTAAARR